MGSRADTGALLLELQELDLQIARCNKTLSDMPEIRELAKKRTAYQKLQGEATKIFAQRKDLETDLADLDAAEAACASEVDQTQAAMAATADYRRLQDFEQKLSDLAKRLDKIAFDRAETQRKLSAIIEQEDRFNEYIKRYGNAMVAETKSARVKAVKLQRGLDEATSARETCASQLPEELLAAYDDAAKRCNGLAVEQLQGSVPSICRTTLAAASLAELRHAGAIGTCPYCHRIIVIPEESNR